MSQKWTIYRLGSVGLNGVEQEIKFLKVALKSKMKYRNSIRLTKS